MQSFYAKILQKSGIPRDQSVLVACGGELDRNTLVEEGFAAVTISNLDERLRGDEFSPYAWSFQDAEALRFPGIWRRPREGRSPYRFSSMTISRIRRRSPRPWINWLR